MASQGRAAKYEAATHSAVHALTPPWNLRTSSLRTFRAHHNQTMAFGAKSPPRLHDVDMPARTVKNDWSNLGPATQNGSSVGSAHITGVGQSLKRASSCFIHAPWSRIRPDSGEQSWRMSKDPRYIVKRPNPSSRTMRLTVPRPCDGASWAAKRQRLCFIENRRSPVYGLRTARPCAVRLVARDRIGILVLVSPLR
jgi:hypothetical protein